MRRLIVSCAAVLALAACGGGGGDGGSTPGEYGNYAFVAGSVTSGLSAEATRSYPSACDSSAVWCATIDGVSETKTSEGGAIYTGKVVSSDGSNGREVALAWSVSASRYVITEATSYNPYNYAGFTVADSGALTGIYCWGFSAIADSCFSLADGSARMAAGTWPASRSTVRDASSADAAVRAAAEDIARGLR
jgi:hypothetical protein